MECQDSTNVTIKMVEIQANDLLIEILVRLPSYSIYRFKFTCKQWMALTSPEFRSLRKIKPSAGIILQFSNSNANCEMRCVPFSSNNSNTILSLPRNKFIIEQSCNGLMLCTKRSGYYVYNPTTNTSLSLPDLDGETLMTKRRVLSLAYDPNESPYNKVISRTCVHGPYNDFLLQIHTYSSDTRCWTLGTRLPLTSFDKHTTLRYLGAGVYWNGSVQWILGSVYFNIENRALKAMPSATWKMGDYFGESCGRLSYTKVCGSTPCIINVYELKRDYSEWLLTYQVTLRNYHSSTISVLSIVHDVGEDGSFLVLKMGRKIVRYNLVSKTSEVLHVLSSTGFSGCAFQYIESPFSV